VKLESSDALKLAHGSGLQTSAIRPTLMAHDSGATGTRSNPGNP
jgi:hypothetical protein